MAVADTVAFIYEVQMRVDLQDMDIAAPLEGVDAGNID